MNFLQKFRGFVSSPSHSRTMGIVIMLVLVSAISLTVIASQQQQTLKQRAAECKLDTSSCDIFKRYTCTIYSYDDQNCQKQVNAVGAGGCGEQDISSGCNDLGKESGSSQITCVEDSACTASNEYNECIIEANTKYQTCLTTAPPPSPTPTPTPTPTLAPKTTPTPTPASFVSLDLSIPTSKPVTGKEITITMNITFSSSNFTAPKRIQFWAAVQDKNWYDVDKKNCSSTSKDSPIYSCAVKVLEKEGGQKTYYGRISFHATDSSWIEKTITFDVETAATTPAPVKPLTNLKPITPKAVYLCGGQGSQTGGPQITISFDINSEAQQYTFNYQIFRTVDNYDDPTPIATLTYPTQREYVDIKIQIGSAYKYKIVVPAAPNLGPIQSGPSLASVCGSGWGGGVGGGQSVTGAFQCSSYLDSQGTATNLKCADVVNGFDQCKKIGSDWSVFKSASTDSKQSGCTAQSLTSEGQVCCKQNAAVAAVPTAIPTAPTATPVQINNVTLALTLNAQDIATTSSNLPIALALYNLTSNTPVNGALSNQLFVKTPIPGKQYSANVPLTNLQQDKYFIVARKDNMIAKAAFNVSSANATISVPTTILVFGDINSDNDINALDYNLFKNCWKKSVDSNPSCASSDFDKSGNVDQLDYNTWLRGFATWKTEGTNL